RAILQGNAGRDAHRESLSGLGCLAGVIMPGRFWTRCAGFWFASGEALCGEALCGGNGLEGRNV
ncbi:hypothetical protein, partial [Acetobacter cerevisiae]|uniref:hypothetical protein n=1 Tax=Acetobacter cerevisiae TaxID=178900 RepID=UPI000AAA86C3